MVRKFLSGHLANINFIGISETDHMAILGLYEFEQAMILLKDKDYEKEKQ